MFVSNFVAVLLESTRPSQFPTNPDALRLIRCDGHRMPLPLLSGLPKLLKCINALVLPPDIPCLDNVHSRYESQVTRCSTALSPRRKFVNLDVSACPVHQFIHCKITIHHHNTQRWKRKAGHSRMDGKGLGSPCTCQDYSVFLISSSRISIGSALEARGSFAT